MDKALQQIIDTVRAASVAGTPLRLRGGGTKDFYGQSLQGEVLDTRALNGVVSYEPSELVVTLRAGTPLSDLQALLAQHGQCLPFEPPHFGAGATVGGMVAAGLSGPARASVGSVRDYVLGAVMLNGRAEQLTFGGQVMKNVAGYDVSRLLAGSLGTLGLLVEVSLKVLPVAPAEATLHFEIEQEQALQRLHEWGGQPLPLNASCWVHDQGRGHLYVRLRGAVAAVEAACRKMGGERQDNAQVAGDWRACAEQTLPFFAASPAPHCGLWRVSLPQTASVLALPYPQLVEWHGGLRWLWAPAREAERIRSVARAAGGHATLWRADVEQDKSVGVFAPLAAPLQRIHRDLKAEFDPAGIFNRARMYPDF